jgi:hypothetical protein
MAGIDRGWGFQPQRTTNGRLLARSALVRSALVRSARVSDPAETLDRRSPHVFVLDRRSPHVSDPAETPDRRSPHVSDPVETPDRRSSPTLDRRSPPFFVDLSSSLGGARDPRSAPAPQIAQRYPASRASCFPPSGFVILQR